uniref:Replicase n=3 Tax=Entoleuca hypovirus 1 TaxID=2086643 RepID=A0A2P1CQF9_9VIRU|nr:replicase [Entoleuca hypovirus 1]
MTFDVNHPHFLPDRHIDRFFLPFSRMQLVQNMTWASKPEGFEVWRRMTVCAGCPDTPGWIWSLDANVSSPANAGVFNHTGRYWELNWATGKFRELPHQSYLCRTLIPLDGSVTDIPYAEAVERNFRRSADKAAGVQPKAADTLNAENLKRIALSLKITDTTNLSCDLLVSTATRLASSLEMAITKSQSAKAETDELNAKLDIANTLIATLRTPAEAAKNCTHLTTTVEPYDHPFIDASRVNRVLPRPPVTTWFATGTTHYRYVWDGTFYPFGGPVLEVPSADPTWDAGRRAKTPKNTFNVRGRGFKVIDGRKTLLDLTTSDKPVDIADAMDKALRTIHRSFHKEYKMIVSHEEFKPVFRKHRWCSHLARNAYNDDTAHVVADSNNWIVTYHPTTLVIWSKECVPYAQHTLPFDTITSRGWARTIPDHDHRWASESAEKGYYSHVVKAGEVLSPNYDSQLVKYSGRARDWTHNMPTCGCNPGIHRFALNGKRLCHRCFEAIAPTQDWPLQKQYHETAPSLELILPYIVHEEGQLDKYIPQSATLDIHFSNPGFWFHLQDGPLGKSYGIRPRPHTYMTRRLTFPFPVYYSDTTPARDFRDLSFYLTRIDPNHKLLPSGTEILAESFCIPSQDHLRPYNLTFAGSLIRGFHKSKEPKGVRCVYLDPCQGDRLGNNGEPFWELYKGQLHEVLFPLAAIQFGHGWHGNYPVFNVNFDHPAVRIKQITMTNARALGPNVTPAGGVIVRVSPLKKYIPSLRAIRVHISKLVFLGFLAVLPLARSMYNSTKQLVSHVGRSSEWIEMPSGYQIFVERATATPAIAYRSVFRLTGIVFIDEALFYPAVLLLACAVLSAFTLWGACIYYSRNPGVEFPLKENPNNLVTVSETASAPTKGPEIAESMLIVTCGTRGDHVPMMFYARIAATLGVPVHVWNAHLATHEELAALKRGDFTPWLPSWLSLLTSTIQGYKFAFVPHVPVRDNAENYYLGGTRKWVVPTVYGEDYMSKFVTWVSTTFRPHWTIGALSDNNLPRSADGVNPVVRRKNYGTGKIGWLSGSADEINIPFAIRSNYPKITDPNHTEAFRHYDTIYMHGGKGTVDTALASGVRQIVILDQSMDRVYHTIPTPEDVRDHSVLPYIGMLYVRGFNIPGSPWYKAAAITSYYYQQWSRLLTLAADTAIRSWIVWQYALSWYNWWIIATLSFPWVIDAFKTKEVKHALRKSTVFLWKYPIFILLPVRWLAVGVFYLIFNAIPKIAGELANLRETKSVMIIKPVAGMPMPFGHVIFKCNVTGEVFEGVHLDEQGFDERFKLITRSALVPGRSRLWRTEHVTHSLVTVMMLLLGFTGIVVNFWHPFSVIVMPFWAMFALAIIILFEGYMRDIPADEPIEIPMPFNTQELREITENARVGTYGPLFNCQTVLLGHAFNHGFFSFYILLALYTLSLTVMIPGWVATKICRKWSLRICGVDVSSAILRQTRPAAGFGGAPDTNSVPVVQQVGQAVKSLNIHLAKPAKALSTVKDWLANDPRQNEETIQLCMEEDIAAANLTASELETLSRPAWEWTPQAKAIVTKIRNAAIHRISTADQLIVAGRTFKKGTRLTEIQAYLRDLKVPEEQMPSTIEDLIVKQDEATQQFESMESIVAQIATLFHLTTNGKGAFSKDAGADIAIKTLINKVSTTNVEFKRLPLPVNHPKSERREWWAKFVDLLHEAFGYLRNVEFVGSFFRWLEERQTKVSKYLWDLFDFFLAVAKILIAVSQKAWNTMWQAVNILFDNTMEPMSATRAKAAWALSGLTEIPRLVAKSRLEKSIAMSSYAPRGDFWKDYQNWTDEMNRAALETGMDPSHAQKVGGPMTRKVKWTMPTMTRELGRALELKEGEEFFVDERLNDRAEYYRQKGVPLGGDAAFIRSADYIQRSLHRYTPDFNPDRPSHEVDTLEKDMALAFFDKHREMFADMKLSSFQEVRRYMYMKTKDKTSPGAGLIGHWSKREQAFLSGWDDAMIHLAEQRLLDGHYPVMLHHAMVKAQVVDIAKVVGEGKNLRTVVAEDLLTYFMNQAIELERNKRRIPEVGMGMGMVLNQNMARLFENLRIHADKNGGVLTYADATEYDSKTPPAVFRMLGHLADLGLKDHPSGNGKAMASVLKAKYDALQDSFIFGLTIPNVVSSVALNVDLSVEHELITKYPSKFIRWQDVYNSDPKKIGAVADSLRAGSLKALRPEDEYHQLYAGKVLLVREPFDSYVSQEPTDNTKLARVRNLVYSPIYATVRQGDSDCTDRAVNFTTLVRRDPVQFALDLWQHRDTAYNVIHKDQGGGTGENATSWDNSVGFRLAYWMGWYKYHNGVLTPQEIMERHPLYNTGDDDIGSNLIKRKDLNLERLVKCMADAGLNLKMFAVDNIEEMEYLGKIYCPTGNYTPGLSQRSFEAVQFDRATLEAHARSIFDYDRQAAIRSGKPLDEVKFPIQPKWLVVQREGDLLMRRMNFRWYQSEREGSVKISNPLYTGENGNHGQVLSLRGRQYLAVAIQRSVGHGQLTAFQPQLYRLFGNEWKEDILDYARHFDTKVRVQWLTDNYGMPYLEIHHDDPKANIPGSKQWQFRQFLKSNKYPGYLKIVKTHMKPEVIDPTEHERFMAKLAKSKAPLDDFMRAILDVSKDVIGDMPREIYKMQPSLLALYPDETFYTRNSYVENFILRVHGEKLTSLSQFQSLVNQSPYGGCADAPAAWQAYQEPEYREKLHKHSVAAYANMCIMTTLIYGCLYPFEKMVSTIVYIGTAYRLLMFMLIDLPKVYSVLNLSYWHTKAESSKEISAIMPRDPYIQSKRFSAFLADFIPLEIGEYLPFYHAMLFLPEVVELCAKVIRRSGEIKASRNERFINPWDARVRHEDGEFQLAATQLITNGKDETRRSKDRESIYRPVVVSSGTGSGKSTLFPYSLLSLGHTVWKRPVRRVIILAPRKILINQWGSPLDNPHSHYKVQRLSRSIVIDLNARILMGTYGHMLNRIKNNEFGQDDIFLMDEFHELSGEMMACVQELYATKVRLFFLSATPVSLPNVQTVFWNTGFQPRFSKSVYIRDDTPVNNFFWGREQFPEHAKSAIIRVSTFKEVEEVREALSYRNIRTHEVSANTADQDIPNDDTVLVTTQIIDAGINLPGRRMLVPSGKMLKNINGEMQRGWTDPNTEKQIEGRVGRFQEGDVIIRPSQAGTGEKPEPYSAPSYFAGELYARLTKVPQLTTFRKVPQGYYYDPDIHGVAFRKGVDPALKLLVYMILAGCSENEAKDSWERLFGRGKPVPDHYEMLVTYRMKHSINYKTYQGTLNELLNENDKKVLIFFKRLTADSGRVQRPIIGQEEEVTAHILSGFIKPVQRCWTQLHSNKTITRFVNAEENQHKAPVEVMEGILKEQERLVSDTLAKAIKSTRAVRIKERFKQLKDQFDNESTSLKNKIGTETLPEGLTFVHEEAGDVLRRTAVLRTPQCLYCKNTITHYHTGIEGFPTDTWGLRWEPAEQPEEDIQLAIPKPKSTIADADITRNTLLAKRVKFAELKVKRLEKAVEKTISPNVTGVKRNTNPKGKGRQATGRDPRANSTRIQHRSPAIIARQGAVLEVGGTTTPESPSKTETFSETVADSVNKNNQPSAEGSSPPSRPRVMLPTYHGRSRGAGQL